MGLFEDVMMYSDGKIGNCFSGIVTGTVKENYNKDFPGKIKVELFLGETGKNVTGWISVMTPYAGADHGFYALPEIGSEVVVAFNMGDRNRPVVIGSLWSEKNKLPKETVTEKNTIKSFVTKGGNEIVLDDTQDKQKLTIKTKSGMELQLDDEKQSITFHDKDNKNGLLIDAKNGAVTVTAEKKLVLKVGGKEAGIFDNSQKKISLSSSTVEVKADKDFTAKGQNTSLSGTSVKISGTSSLQVSSNGSTQVKGTMVKIN